MSFIVDKNNTYSNKKASDVNDIRYALYAGAKFNECILAHSMAAVGKDPSFESLPRVQTI